MKNIEIEHRAQFSEEKYKQLKDFLTHNSKDLGEDNRETHFFVFPDKFLKVTTSLSQNKSKVSLKTTKIGESVDAEEIEVSIDPTEAEKMVKIFKSISSENTYIPTKQLRHNYDYKGVELALKHSEEWGYHLELEVMVEKVAEKDEAEHLIKAVATELDVTLMTEQELLDLTRAIESKHKK